MTIGLPRSGLLLLILACTVRAALAQAPAAPLLYADDFAALGQSVAASGLPIMLVFTRPGCPFCARAKQDHLEPLNASPGYGAKVVIREIEAPNALIPLRDNDSTPAFGLLVLGSPDPTRYSADMGTEFLVRIGEIVSEMSTSVPSLRWRTVS